MMRKKVKKSMRSVIVNRVASTLLIVASLSIVFNIYYRIKYDEKSNNRHELTYYASEIMNATEYLTAEAKSYAATGLKTHYDNYWHEVNVVKRRENGIAKLKEIGITPVEEGILDRFLYISNSLIPLESEAMDLAGQGDTLGAITIMYGNFYSTALTQLETIKQEFLAMLEERTSNDIETMTTYYNLFTIITGVLLAVVILLQQVQRRSLHRLAYVDQLTGSNNYNAFRDKMESANSVHGAGYIISVDLRNFSTINDICGIAKGDDVICEMSKILEKNIKRGELSAHIVGDKFVLFLHSKDGTALEERLEMIRKEIIGLSIILDVPHVVPLFGICEVNNTFEPENDYGKANLAKTLLKDRADVSIAVYDDSIRKHLHEVHEVEDRFEGALLEHQFEMWYQPKYSPKNDTLVGAEALVRWRNPDGSLTPPGKFIPIFEKNGMIAKLDEYTFNAVCMQQRKWLDLGKPIVPVSVNLSRASLHYSDIVERYIKIFKQYDIPVRCIEIEITESSMSARGTERLIHDFQSFGFHILVDDFGSGYSSLSTLTKDYFNCIKLDKSLIDDINTTNGKSLIRSTIEMAHEFSLSVTAEGVEVKEQVEILKELSCDSIQGYFYSRPLPVNDFNKLYN